MKNPAHLFDELTRWTLDGGMATELEKKGVDLNHELWSARALKDKPEAIFDTHLRIHFRHRALKNIFFVIVCYEYF